MISDCKLQIGAACIIQVSARMAVSGFSVQVTASMVLLPDTRHLKPQALTPET
jgi:hypothetical protein